MKFVIFILFLFMFSCLKEDDQEFILIFPTNLSTQEYNIAETLNLYRNRNNIEELLLDKLHSDLAEIRINDILINGFDHNGFNEISHYLYNVGIVNHAEILSRGHTDPALIINAWSNSNEHSFIMLKDWKYMGVKYYNGYTCVIFSK